MILRILSLLFVICSLILMILHFAIGLDIYWFAIPLAIGVIFNLIESLRDIKRKRLNKDKKTDEDNINE